MVIMAHCTGFPFVMSLLFFFFFVSCSRIPPTTPSAEVPVSVSAKATTAQYWNRIVVSNSRPPPALLAHLSNSSPQEIIANLNKVGVVFGDEARDHAYDRGGSNDNKARRSSNSPDPSKMFIYTAEDMAKWSSNDSAVVRFKYDTMFAYTAEDNAKKGESVSHRVEPGIFFRKSQLKKGAAMPIADLQLPHLNFLPRSIASRIPLSADAVRELFHVPTDSPMGKAVATTIDECRQAPPEGETRRCVTSAEDMIDYVVSSLGAKGSLTARSTDSSNGLGGSVLIGEVKAANGGKLVSVVACHQAAFPYLLYQCHKVPETKLYEVEILDPETKVRINLAPAICHFDTSAWSPSHPAFVALGHERGMEVCHWMFPVDMAWTAASE